MKAERRERDAERQGVLSRNTGAGCLRWNLGHAGCGLFLCEMDKWKPASHTTKADTAV